MALSKSTRIIILLVIDSAFFLVELIVGELRAGRSLALLLVALANQVSGSAVHSLALVADSFHMVRHLPCIILLTSNAGLFTDYKML